MAPFTRAPRFAGAAAVVLAFLLIAMAFGGMCLAAVVLGVAVPTLLVEPTNFWAWLGVLLVASNALGAGGFLWKRTE